MSENISKLMYLEQQIIKFINDNENLDDPIVDDLFNDTGYVDKCINILKKMNNHDVIEAIIRFEYIPLFVDYKVFLKRYLVNKKLLKEEPSNCLEEYRRLDNICERINDICSTKDDYINYLKILDVDHAFEEILKLMPNEDLNKLAQETSDWTEKLYYYSFLKKDN